MVFPLDIRPSEKKLMASKLATSQKDKNMRENKFNRHLLQHIDNPLPEWF